MCKHCQSKDVKERHGYYICEVCKQATRINNQNIVRLLDEEGAAQIRRTLGFE